MEDKGFTGTMAEMRAMLDEPTRDDVDYKEVTLDLVKIIQGQGKKTRKRAGKLIAKTIKQLAEEQLMVADAQADFEEELAAIRGYVPTKEELQAMPSNMPYVPQRVAVMQMTPVAYAVSKAILGVDSFSYEEYWEFQRLTRISRQLSSSRRLFPKGEIVPCPDLT